MIANHNAVHARVQIQNEIEKTETITYRKIKNINKEKFANDLETAVTKIQHQNSLADKVERYNIELKGVLDKHAPVKTKTVKITHQNPWFNDKIMEEIRLRRKKERAWNKDPTFYNFQAFYYPRRYVANLTKATRSENFKSQIVEHHGDYKAIYRVANKLLFRNEMSPLPKADDQAQLAEDFNNFFSDKIANIMTVLKKSNPYPEYIELGYFTTERFTCFTLTNQSDLMEIISKTATKSCELDPINTNILKENIKSWLQHLWT